MKTDIAGPIQIDREIHTMANNKARHFLCAVVTASVLGVVSTAHSAPPTGKGKPDSGGDGDTTTTTDCGYPSFSDAPKDKLRGADADFWGKYGDRINEITSTGENPTPLVFEEDGSAVALQSTLNGDGNWFIEDMMDNQHRVGEDATPGRRYSAWYDWTDPSGLIHSDGNILELGGLVSGISDDSRENLPGFETKLYTTWLSTFQRDTSNGEPGVYAPAKPGSLAFKPPMYFETKVDFSKMQTPGFRLSMWLMPVEEPGQPIPDAGAPSIAYDSNFENGYEIDIFEYEPVKVITDDGVPGSVQDVCGNLIEFSWINSFESGKGRASSIANGKNHFEGDEEGYCTDGSCSTTYAFNGIQPDLNDPVIDSLRDMNDSSHIIGLLWTDDTIAWSFNGEIVLEIFGAENISTNPHYLIVSREMTTGKVSDDGTGLPVEPGLYGFNGNSDVGNNTQYINADKAQIDYIRVWGGLVTEW